MPEVREAAQRGQRAGGKVADTYRKIRPFKIFYRKLALNLLFTQQMSVNLTDIC